MKAEERAKERYWLEPNNIETQEKYAAYVEGYHQAEKDLELTWEDMLIIHRHIKDAMNKYLYAFQTVEGQQKIYEDVLKRFKERKGEEV